MISQENATEAFDPHSSGATRHDGLELAEKNCSRNAFHPQHCHPASFTMANRFVIFFSQEMKRNHPPAVSPARSTDFLRSQTWEIGNRVRERCLASIAGRASLVKTRARKLIKSLLLLALFFTFSTPAHFSSDGGDPTGLRVRQEEKLLFQNFTRARRQEFSKI